VAFDTCPARLLRAPAGERSVVLPVVGGVDGELTDGLCAVVRAMLEERAVDVVTFDTASAGIDLRLVGALARAQLTAKRLGCAIRVRGDQRLVLLVDLVGLRDVLPRIDQRRRSVRGGGDLGGERR
jgi:hypothetical protein